MPGNPKRNQRGVLASLILFVLIMVLTFGVFGDFAFVFVLDKPDKAKWEKAQADMATISEALRRFAVDHEGTYPAELEALTTKHFPNGVPKDPFSKSDYLYERTATGFTLTSLGKDLAPGDAEIPNRDIIFDETGQR